MTGTFSSLNTALRAMRYQRIAMDVASNNIANVSSEGYVRRRAEAVALGSPQQVAMWSRYDGSGDGVALSGITRMGDPFLDMRSRREHGQQSYLDARVAVLDRVEGAIGEPGDTGVSAALADFRNAWQDLQSHPESAAARRWWLAVSPWPMPCGCRPATSRARCPTSAVTCSTWSPRSTSPPRTWPR